VCWRLFDCFHVRYFIFSAPLRGVVGLVSLWGWARALFWVFCFFFFTWSLSYCSPCLCVLIVSEFPSAFDWEAFRWVVFFYFSMCVFMGFVLRLCRAWTSADGGLTCADLFLITFLSLTTYLLWLFFDFLGGHLMNFIRGYFICSLLFVCFTIFVVLFGTF